MRNSDRSGSGRGCAPGLIPLKLTHTTDGKFTIETEVPPDYLLYAAGLYGVWKAAEWVAKSLPAGDLDLLGAVSLGT